MVGLITGAYGVTQLIFRIPLGTASDKLGLRKPFVMGGFLVIMASCVGLAWAPTPSWMFFFRALSGVAASVWVMITVLFAGLFPADRAVQASGIVNFFAGIGQMAATGAGGWVADTWGWLAPYIGGAILAVMGILCLIPLKEVRTPRANRLTLARFRHVVTMPTLIMVSLIAAFDQYAMHTTLQGFVPLYAEGLGASKTILGALASLTLGANVVTSLLSSRIAPKIGEERAIRLGLIVVFVAVVMIPWTSTVPMLIFARILHGIGRGITYPVAMGLSIKSVPQEERASAMGIFQAVYAVGMFAGPAISGIVAENWGLSAVFWTTSVFSLIGLGLTFSRGFAKPVPQPTA
jgi:MFS family permease